MRLHLLCFARRISIVRDNAAKEPTRVHDRRMADLASTVPDTTTELSARVRKWSVRATSALLLIQAFILLGATARLGSGIDWQAEVEDVMFSAAAINIVAFACSFVPLAVLTLLVVVGILLRRRAAWIVAMVIQGLVLAATLLIYFDGYRPLELYIIMLYAIVVVLYLNTGDVRATFFSRPEAELADGR